MSPCRTPATAGSFHSDASTVTFVNDFPALGSVLPQLLFPASPVVVTAAIILVEAYRDQVMVARIGNETDVRGLHLDKRFGVVYHDLVGRPLGLVAAQIVEVFG